MIERHVDVITDENGLPQEIWLDDNEGVPHNIKILDINLQDPLIRSKQSMNGVNNEIYGYEYKTRLCLSQMLITGILIHLVEEDKWILQLKS